MRGKVTFKPPRVNISGTWASNEADTVWSEFAYRSTGPVILPAEVTPSTPPIDFEATGHFMVAQPGNAKGVRCNETAMLVRIGGPVWPEAKPAERPADKPDAPLVGVRGEGRNKHGTFRLVGSFCPASRAIFILKVYTGTADDSKRASRDAAKRSRGAAFPALTAAGRPMRAASLEPKAAAAKLSRPLQSCLAVTRSFLSNQAAAAFREPVDPVKHHCPTYFDVIKAPMDLSTVLRRLLDGHYATHEQWAADMTLVFANATAFNPPQHWLHSTAAALLTDFRKRYSSIVEAASGGGGAQGAAARAGLDPNRRGGQRKAAAKAQRVHAAAARASRRDEDLAARRASGPHAQRAAREQSAASRSKPGRAKRARPDAYDAGYGDDDEDDDDDSLALGLESDDDDAASSSLPRRKPSARSKRPRSSADLKQENQALSSRLGDMQAQMEQMQSVLSTLIAHQGSGESSAMLADLAASAASFGAPAPAPAPAPRRRRAAPVDPASRPLTVAEQKQLKVDWEELTDDQERRALDIIAESMPIDDETRELDLKDVDPKTLRSVQRFVASCVGRPVRPAGSGKKPRKAPAPRRQSSSSSSSSSAAAAIGHHHMDEPAPAPPPSLLATSAPSPAPVMAGGPIPSLIDNDWEGLDDDDDDLGALPPVPGAPALLGPTAMADGAPGPLVSAAAAVSSSGQAAAANPPVSSASPLVLAEPAAFPPSSSASASSSSSAPVTLPPASAPSLGATQDALIQSAAARREAELRAQESKTKAEQEEAARREAARAAEEEARRADAEARAAEEAARKRAEEEAAERVLEAKREAARAQAQAQAAAQEDDDDDDDDDDEGGAGPDAASSSSSSSSAFGPSGLGGAGAFGAGGV